MNIQDVIALSNYVGEMGSIKRATKLPDGTYEPDSHHAFSLALIAYQVCMSEKIPVDVDKVVRFALVHDLLEIITGDEQTLHYTAKQQAEKYKREQVAMKQFEESFKNYPDILQALHDYEKLDTPEAATVFVLDKACTTWTHHVHHADSARELGVMEKQHVRDWAERQKNKITLRLQVQPPQKIFDIYVQSFKALEGLYEN